MIRPGDLRLTARAMDLWQLPTGSMVLDIGCGRGESVEFVSKEYGLRAKGIDISEEMIRDGLARNPQLDLCVGQGEDLSVLGEEQFQGIMLECVLSLFSDPSLALQKISHHLPIGGKIFISDLYLKDLASGTERMTTSFFPSGVAESDIVCEEDLSCSVSKDGCVSCKRLKLPRVLDCLSSCGYGNIHWEDCSDELPVYVATKLMQDGDMSGCFFEQTLDVAEKKKTGYFLLTAEKMR